MEYNGSHKRREQHLRASFVPRNSALILQLANLMVNPKFARNKRGRLASALRLVDAPLQMKLACDYAEHVVWICEETVENPPFRDIIAETKRFIHGKATIENVAQARYALYNALHEYAQPYSWQVQVAVDAAWCINLAIRVCCQRKLEGLGVVARFRQQPRADVVATKASYAVARYYGGEDWDSDDPKLKAAARKRGKAASDAETQWQMNRLLEAVGAHDCAERKAFGLNGLEQPRHTPELAAYG